ncbi:dTDP-4-dehydrorhamnose 3,5-epimerase family protein [Chloroflexota bacterium]
MVEGKKYDVTTKRLIDGVELKQLRVICDERGKLMEMMRCDDPFYQKFGQIYVTTCEPGVVKAWHYHKKQTDIFVVVKGMSKVALYDPREGSPTKGLVNEFFMGEYNPTLITIPPMVIHGQKAYGAEPAYLVNCPTELYDYQNPDEFRIDPFDNDIPYDWSLKQG